jgi:hypothetical protein
MNAFDIERDAAQLLADAIKAGRLPRRPELATLNRIASIVAPVLQQKSKEVRGGTRKTSPKA